MTQPMPADHPRRQSLEVRAPEDRPSTPGAAADAPCPGPIDRWDAIALVKSARRHLGLAPRDIAVLEAHLTTLPKGPLRPGTPLFSFMEVGKLVMRAGAMDERTFRRGERRLEEAGLVRRRLSANGRRFPRRGADGRIVDAYGIDLSPLLGALAELRTAVERIERRAAERRNRLSEIRAVLADASRRARDGACRLPDALMERMNAVRRRIRRAGLEDVALAAAEADAAQIAAEARERIERMEAPQPRTIDAVRPPARPADVPGAAGPIVRPIAHRVAAVGSDWDVSHPYAACSRPDRSAAHDGQSVRRMESPRREDPDWNAEQRLRHEVGDAWARSPNVQGFFGDAPRSGRELASVLERFSSCLGLTGALTTRAIAVFGLGGVIEVMDDLASRLPKVRNPSGYLVSMIRAFEKGDPVASGRVRPRAA